MNADSLQKGLEAIMGSDMPDEDKDTMSKALAADFANDTSNVSDDDAVDAMPADVAAAYKSDETPAEQKANNLKATKLIVLRAEARAIVKSVAEKLKAGKQEEGKGKEGCNGSEAVAQALKALPGLIETAVDKAHVKRYGTMGNPADKETLKGGPGNPQASGGRTGSEGGGKDFYKEHVAPLIGKVQGGITFGPKQALAAARKAKPEEFNAWQAAKANR